MRTLDPHKMKHSLLIALIVAFVSSMNGTNAASDANSSLERAAVEGWHWVGIPIEDWAPYHLEIDAKEITGFEKKYVVVYGYLVASAQSIILFPSEEASRTNHTERALILSRNDSPALRWLAPTEGYYAVGGTYRNGTKTFLGHLSYVRFAMKKEAGQSPSESSSKPVKPHDTGENAALPATSKP